MSSIDIGELLGTGKEAEVYEHGALVLKLYRVTASKSAAFREAAILAQYRAIWAAGAKGFIRQTVWRPLGTGDDPGLRAADLPTR